MCCRFAKSHVTDRPNQGGREDGLGRRLTDLGSGEHIVKQLIEPRHTRPKTFCIDGRVQVLVLSSE